MAVEVFIPQLGQTVEQVTILTWYVEDGAQVKQGQEILEVETDKTVFDVEAGDSGYIHIGPYKVGDVVPVLEVVALIGEKDDVFTAPKSAPEKADKPSEAKPKPHKKAEEPAPRVEEAAKTTPAVAASAGKHFVSPRARKLADARGVDLSLITPTGGGGIRVREQDVINYLNRQPAAAPAAWQFAPIPLPEMEITETIPLKGVRGVTAERMAASAHTTARVTLLMDVDATELVALREKLKGEKESAWGFKPGYNDLLAKAGACALRRFPYMNARINGESIERLAPINIGIAVDAARGLFVPVIPNVDQKDLQTVGKEFRQRVEEVRSGKIQPEHLSNGTFTITNLGMYDVDGFTPVINLPEAAILGVGRITPKPVVRDGEVVIRSILTLSLVFDHRLVDGAPAAQFLQYLKDLLESPNEVTLTK